MIHMNSIRSRLGTRLRRHCVSSTKKAAGAIPPPPAAITHVPPLPARLLLVGSAVGLCTPLFAVGGAVGVWRSILPKSRIGQVLKYIALVACGGSTVTVLYKVVIPVLGQHSELVMPFALSNSITSMVWYGALESFLGLEALSTLSVATMHGAVPRAVQSVFAAIVPSALTAFPLAGPMVGVLTALTAPFLWPTAFDYCWNEEMRAFWLQKDEAYWLVDLYNWIAVPIGIPCGLLAGSALSLALRTTVTGAAAIPWTNSALPMLAGLVGGSMYYFTQCRPSLNEPLAEIFWVSRMCPTTGKRYSVNVRTNETSLEHTMKADKSAWTRYTVMGLHYLRNPYQLWQLYVEEKEAYLDAIIGQKKLLAPLTVFDGMTKVTVNNVDEYEVMTTLCDGLSRYHYLHHSVGNAAPAIRGGVNVVNYVNKDGSITSAPLASLKSQLNDFELYLQHWCGIKNVASLLRYLEVISVLQRQLSVYVEQQNHLHNDLLESLQKEMNGTKQPSTAAITETDALRYQSLILELRQNIMDCVEAPSVDRAGYTMMNYFGRVNGSAVSYRDMNGDEGMSSGLAVWKVRVMEMLVAHYDGMIKGNMDLPEASIAAMSIADTRLSPSASTDAVVKYGLEKVQERKDTVARDQFMSNVREYGPLLVGGAVLLSAAATLFGKR